jgi:two-component system, OmpR family, sensor histidine kinase MprB
VSLRTRIGVAAAVAVAVGILVASTGLYVATRQALHGTVDRGLAELAREVHQAAGMAGRPRVPGGLRPGLRPGHLGGAGAIAQVVTANGRVLVGPDAEATLPVDGETLDLARDGGDPFFRTVDVSGLAVRVLTVPMPGGGAVQLARPLGEVADTLALLRRRLVAGGALAIVLAAVLGSVVARRAVRPVEDLTAVARDVAATADLTRRIDVHGDDEIATLARTFNAMLANLEQARQAQQQLVADASHELRTPLTSLRTNIEVLAESDRLSVADRRALVGDVVAQLDELAGLLGGLIELARGEQPARDVTPVRLDEVAAAVVARARIHAPADQVFELDTDPTTVLAEADRLERAVANLVDNAVKHGGGTPVTVRVADGALTVRDRGPGIPPAHLPHVFDRFYRAPEARSTPGSGLGLAIVEQVVRAHGGTVVAANAADGGAELTLRLPGAPAGVPAQSGP